jgi:hypothetical protein
MIYNGYGRDAMKGKYGDLVPAGDRNIGILLL